MIHKKKSFDNYFPSEEPDDETPFQDASKEYATYDLGASAALLVKGHELLALNRSNPRKVKFIFKRQDDTEEIVNKYLLDALSIKARTYFDTIKALKNRMYSY